MSVKPCQRCGQLHDESLLAPPSAWLRILAIPFFWMLPRSPVVERELAASYCPFCRRQLNFCLFFLAFMVVVVGVMLLVAALLKHGLLPQI